MRARRSRVRYEAEVIVLKPSAGHQGPVGDGVGQVLGRYLTRVGTIKDHGRPLDLAHVELAADGGPHGEGEA